MIWTGAGCLLLTFAIVETNTQPYTLHPQPYNLHHAPYAINPQLSTHTPHPYTLPHTP